MGLSKTDLDASMESLETMALRLAYKF